MDCVLGMDGLDNVAEQKSDECPTIVPVPLVVEACKALLRNKMFSHSYCGMTEYSDMVYLPQWSGTGKTLFLHHFLTWAAREEVKQALSDKKPDKLENHLLRSEVMYINLGEVQWKHNKSIFRNIMRIVR